MKQLLLLIILIVYIPVFSAPYINLEVGWGYDLHAMQIFKMQTGYHQIFENGIDNRVYVGIVTYTTQENPTFAPWFNPFENVYIVGDELTYNNWYFRIEHMCAHPVNSGLTRFFDKKGDIVYARYYTSPMQWSGNLTSLSIGYKYEFK
jgi:hypothetical protein